MLPIKVIFNTKCLKFVFKFENNCLPSFFQSILRYNHELHDFATGNRNQFHLFPIRTEGARSVLRHYIPKLLQEFPAKLLNFAYTHSINTLTYRLKVIWLIHIAPLSPMILLFLIMVTIKEFTFINMIKFSPTLKCNRRGLHIAPLHWYPGKKIAIFYGIEMMLQYESSCWLSNV